MIPMPPSLANAIAIADSVTVSIFALTNGIFIEILRDNLVLRSVWDLDIMGERFGISKTSSNVNPSLIINIPFS